ncbi:MAG: hypothetical protein WC477_06960 [Patescibacteria group bacterium]
MAWQIVKQPNGLLARWSDIVDTLTHTNGDFENMVALCMERYDMSRADATDKVNRAIQNPARWEECIRTITTHHGKPMADAFVEECSSVLASK